MRLLLLIALAFPCLVKGQTLTVVKEGATPVGFSITQLAEMPHAKVKAKEHDGTESTFEGIELHQILRKAEVTFGEALRGPALGHYVLVTAEDGYRAIFSLPEIDPAFTDNPVYLVDARDGEPLDETMGPLRLVLPKEKRHARWMRQVVRIEIIKAPGKEKPAKAPY